MKVEQKDKDFRPVTITLETKEEVERLYWWLAYGYDRSTGINKAYQTVRKYLVDALEEKRY